MLAWRTYHLTMISALAFSCTACSSSSEVSPEVLKGLQTMKELGDKTTQLQAQLNLVSTRLGRVEFSQNLKNSEWKSAVFDPTESAFQRIDSQLGVGSFAVSIQDVRQFGDGVRVRINLGNLTSATIAGATLHLTYGPRQPDFGDEAFAKKHDDWEKAVKTKDQTVLENLRPGAWNPVNVVLPQIEEKRFGYLEIGISTSRILLAQ